VSQERKTIHILPLCHIVIMLAITTWWGIYFWRHSPSRELFHMHEPTPRQAAQAARHTDLVPKLNFMHSSQGSRFLMAARAGIGDLAWGGAVFLLVALGTGVYVRRLDTWLNARTSGQAVAFRGHDLTSATLDANTQQQRGILR
jgi:hypothetical protein